MADILTTIIEHQEATGQRELIYSDKLPIEGDWDTLERWGVIKGAAIDKLFYSCTLPVGWKKVRTEHSMWSSLVDERGLKRASIFYKAAFYDLDAHFHIVKRFTIGSVYEDCDYDNSLHSKQCEVRDNGLDRVVFRDAAYISAEVQLKTSITLDTVDSLVLSEPTSTVESNISDAVLVIVKDGVIVQGPSPLKDIKGTITLLTNKVFYSTYHTSTITNYPHLQALERLSVVLCEDYLSQFPKEGHVATTSREGDTIWGPEYDYPDISSNL